MVTLLIKMLFYCRKHEDFSLNETRGDIAVLRVDGTINLSHPNIAKVTMAPNDNFDYMPTECWLTGWGLTQGNLLYSDILS